MNKCTKAPLEGKQTTRNAKFIGFFLQGRGRKNLQSANDSKNEFRQYMKCKEQQ